MKSNPLLLSFVCLTLNTACARPDYITPEELNQRNATKQQEKFGGAFSQVNLSVQLEWSKAPSSTEVAELLVTFSKEMTDKLSALLWMPSMGHGSAPVKIENLGEGRYRIYNMYFIMPGDWEVRLFIKDSQGRTLDQLFIPLLVP